MGGLGKEAVDRVSIDQLETKGHAARAAAYAAGQEGEEGMLFIHLDAHLFQLPFQPLGRHSIAHKQIHRVFIVYEIAHGIAFRLTPAFGHRLAVILRIFHHGDSFFPQQILFPLAGIGGHMHTDPESQPSTHNADRQPQIAGGTHGN